MVKKIDFRNPGEGFILKILSGKTPGGKLRGGFFQLLHWNTPHPHFGKLQIWDDQSLLWNTPPPHFGKLQIWDDQSLLWNTPPPFQKASDFGMTKVYSRIPPPPISESCRFWDDQSLLQNTPPFRKASDLG